MQSARGGRRQLLRSANKKVACSRVATSFCAAIAELWLLGLCAKARDAQHYEAAERRLQQPHGAGDREGRRCVRLSYAPL